MVGKPGRGGSFSSDRLTVDEGGRTAHTMRPVQLCAHSYMKVRLVIALFGGIGLRRLRKDVIWCVSVSIESNLQ